MNLTEHNERWIRWLESEAETIANVIRRNHEDITRLELRKAENARELAKALEYRAEGDDVY